MLKHEIKVDISKTEELVNIIEKSYFEEGFAGKIMGQKHYLTIDESDDINYSIFKGLHNATVKVSNEEAIDGTLRFIVNEENGDIRLYPASIYCIREEDRYIFY
jgi:hypothetical protein